MANVAAPGTGALPQSVNNSFERPQRTDCHFFIMDKWAEHLRELKDAIRRAERNTADLRNVLNEVNSLIVKRKNPAVRTRSKKLLPRR